MITLLCALVPRPYTYVYSYLDKLGYAYLYREDMTPPTPNAGVPFDEEFQLCQELYPTSTSTMIYLPGQPRISLQNSVHLCEYLHGEFWATDLERMAPHLWMMSTPSSANISPLHQQKVKGRAIIVTEDPRLHLVWIYDRVFIKPLPKYLLSYSFWTEYLSPKKSPFRGSDKEEQRNFSEIRRSALGFIRTYYYLIQHESDFDIACHGDSRLSPFGISWIDFCNFSKDFRNIGDNLVSERYRYGELRLTRLNYYAKIFLRKFHYERVHGQYGAFFARFYGPLLFIFGVLSIVLSAMQVELGSETLLSSYQWQSFWFACRWFAIITLACMAMLTVACIASGGHDCG